MPCSIMINNLRPIGSPTVSTHLTVDRDRIAWYGVALHWHISLHGYRVGRQLLSTWYEACRFSPVLRSALQLGRGRQHLLPNSFQSNSGGLGAENAGRFHVCRQGAPVMWRLGIPGHGDREFRAIVIAIPG